MEILCFFFIFIYNLCLCRLVTFLTVCLYLTFFILCVCIILLLGLTHSYIPHSLVVDKTNLLYFIYCASHIDTRYKGCVKPLYLILLYDFITSYYSETLNLHLISHVFLQDKKSCLLLYQTEYHNLRHLADNAFRSSSFDHVLLHYKTSLRAINHIIQNYRSLSTKLWIPRTFTR